MNNVLIKTQTNHPNKTILIEIMELLRQIHSILFYKVCANTNIEENEQANKLAKQGRDKEHKDAFNLQEFAHSIPHYFQKDW